MPTLVVSALSTFDNKGLKKGKKEVTAFDKQIKKLGKTFAAIGVGAFAKSAVNAFIESEKAAAKLRTTVKNLGLEFEQPGIEDYLKKLSLQFGIVDENLIPGFQRLLIVTKDVAKAQSLFETALNVSAGTGKDLTAVAGSILRVNAQAMCIFRLRNRLELDAIIEELSAVYDKNTLMEMRSEEHTS